MSPPLVPAYFRLRSSSFFRSITRLDQRLSTYRSLPACVAARTALAQVLRHRRRYRDDHDREHDQGQIVLDPGDVPEQETCISEGRDPGRSAKYVVGKEFAIGHLAHAGEERRERAHDRHESADDDGKATVLFVETVRPLEILRL